LDPQPQTWHFGLIARWWAEFNTDGPEIDYFRGFIERYGQPALDAGCGAGRLLVPYRLAGLDVDGSDISADMIRLCGERLVAEGTGEPPAGGLFVQAMHELELPRRYRTIILCGALGIGGSWAQDREGLRRLRRHLLPGGVLVCDLYLPYEDDEEWRHWTAEGRRSLPEPWPEEGMRRRTADGDEIELLIRLADLDPLEQLATREIHARLWHDGCVVQEERRVLLERRYLRNEVLLMLGEAGFGETEVLRAHTLDPAGPDDGVVVIVAHQAASTGPR
jgi:SAM-dependent methyltransferase